AHQRGIGIEQGSRCEKRIAVKIDAVIRGPDLRDVDVGFASAPEFAEVEADIAVDFAALQHVHAAAEIVVDHHGGHAGWIDAFGAHHGLEFDIGGVFAAADAALEQVAGRGDAAVLAHNHGGGTLLQDAGEHAHLFARGARHHKVGAL